MTAPRGLRPVHYEGIEKQLIKIFRAILFDPIIEIIKDTTKQANTMTFSNAPADELKKSIKAGEIQYTAGIFSGKFKSATTSALKKLGARWIRSQKVFKLDQADVPGWIKIESANYNMGAKAANHAIVKSLDEIQTNLEDALEANKVKAGRMVDQVAADFRDVAKALEIQPTISDQAHDVLTTDYTENMKLWIKKWCEEEIVELRESVEENAMEGYRFDKLIDKIQQRYGVSVNKAKFLARQETALFVSKFNEQRVKEAGVRAYQWSTAHDRRVRDDHKDLDGQMFFFDQPPIVDIRTGRRANPGEDFNCRCVPIPIINVPLAK